MSFGVLVIHDFIFKKICGNIPSDIREDTALLQMLMQNNYLQKCRVKRKESAPQVTPIQYKSRQAYMPTIGKTGLEQFP